jgi:alkylation response protein AidB-like acyl-CoA dehydrogenase
MAQLQNRYRADLRELSFVLFEQYKLESLLGQGVYQDWGRDEVEMSLHGAYSFVTEVLGPLNAIGDKEGCTIVNGTVKTPTGFKEAWKKLYQGGWKSINVDPELGGQGAPYAVYVLVEELLDGANTAFSMYPGLTGGVATLLNEFGGDTQKAKYLAKLLDGTYSGTMCLSEPQAGSDVGMARTKAVKRGDGLYNLSGTKIFISCGDHDMTENIVHMVLARVEGAPAGTKGLSLFLVPKRRVSADGISGESNDVQPINVEHKMGLNGSATCVLNFGENGNCIGELVGSLENSGMRQMFFLMNYARIATGIQGVGIAAAAYMNTLDYAKTRKQGASIEAWKDANAPRVNILQHADIRRSLLEMKSKVEGIRSLIVKLAWHVDNVRALGPQDEAKIAYHRGQVDLLVPLVKAYGSDQAFRICETAIQVHGGVGYTRDYPVEQHLRDSKVFSIYEGTNHIQAMDLVARKLSQDGGAHFRGFLEDIGNFVAKNQNHPELGAEVIQLANACESLSSTAMLMMGWSGDGRLMMIPLASNRFLEMMSEVAVGWLLLDAAVIAHNALKKASLPQNEKNFYEGKKQSARFFAHNILPGVEAKAKVLFAEDTSPMDISDDSFATL